LALDLDQRALAGIGVDVRLDDALGGAAAAALRRRSLALLAEDLDGLRIVSARLLQGVLDVHDGGAGALSKGLHVGRCHRHQDSPVCVWAGSGVGSGSSAGGGCGTSMAASRLASSSEPFASCGACSPS